MPVLSPIRVPRLLPGLAKELEVNPLEAISPAGTHVPHFQASRRGLAPDGEHPTLLYGYGGSVK